jgi:hypothetical protein
MGFVCLFSNHQIKKKGANLYESSKKIKISKQLIVNVKIIPDKNFFF